MRIYPLIFNTVFKPMDAELAHKIGFLGVKMLRSSKVSTSLHRFMLPSAKLQTTAMGLTFPSPFGLAAGFDKEGSGINALGDLGFGHVEIGTVTGSAQPGNPRKRLFRLVDDFAVINRMGFNNDGAEVAAQRVKQARENIASQFAMDQSRRPIIGVNIGKTKKVELDNAIEDYRFSTRTLAPFADYLTVNVSSPNTPGLRTLQAVETLRPLLEAVRDEIDATVSSRHIPLLVKIAPDLSDEEIVAIAQLAMDMKLDGIIATNTTIARDNLGLKTPMAKVEECGAGGLSGRPLKERSLEVTRLLKKTVGDQLCIVSVGGVTSGYDVKERLDAGATLVQGYSAFLYEGPLWAARINRQLSKIM